MIYRNCSRATYGDIFTMHFYIIDRSLNIMLKFIFDSAYCSLKIYRTFVYVTIAVFATHKGKVMTVRIKHIMTCQNDSIRVIVYRASIMKLVC